MTWIK